MRERIGRIVCCSDKDGKPITAEDIGCAGAMTVMMKDAIEPTLMQTLEGTPVFVHAGPFANIAHGNSSIVADQIALKLVGKDGFVLTEAGFGADIGAEKFFNIKCKYSGLQPDCAVIVVSLRALKMHGGCKLEETNKENLEAVEKGSENMMKHIENLKSFGIPVIACINHFSADTDKEIEIVKKKAMEAGAFDAVISKHWSEGGRGAVECAKAIEEACKQSKQFKFLYSLEDSIKEKIEKVCKNIYGAKSVDYTEQAEKSIETITKQGFAKLPVCMAKTQYSFSHDPKLLNVPKDFVVVVRDVKASVGAGMIVVYLGEISTMPGLPVRAGYFKIDIDLETGKVLGLY
jgi:formyltetrahydrofolate synthetase